MKRKIEPYRDLWLDCYSTIIFTLLVSIDEKGRLLSYNNNYNYSIRTHHLSDKVSFEGLIFETYISKIKKKVLKNEEKFKVNKLQDILERLKNNKIIFLGVDLYFYIDDNAHWNKNHIMHYSLVYDYDHENKEILVMEAGAHGYNKYRLSYTDLEKAALGFYGESFSYDLAERLDDIMYDKRMIKENAEKIVLGIESCLKVEDKIWNIQNFDKEYTKFFSDIVSTHIYSFQNRQRANKLLFQNVICYCNCANKLFKEFAILEKKYENLKNVFERASFRGNIKEDIFKIRKEVFQNLLWEKELWEIVVASKEIDISCKI